MFKINFQSDIGLIYGKDHFLLCETKKKGRKSCTLSFLKTWLNFLLIKRLYIFVF